MRSRLFLIAIVVCLVQLAPPVAAQETPGTMVTAYDALAKLILDARQAEKDYVTAILDGHYHGAKMLMQRGAHEQAAAEIALFANEGDNAVGGVRKRLIEGGHHHNAAGEEAGVYEPGYVIITREAKQQLLAASAGLRRATDDDARHKAWEAFEAIAADILE